MITLATFDILDKELTRAAEEFLKIPLEDRWDNSAISFHLDPFYWDNHWAEIVKYKDEFNWSEIKYSEYNDLDLVIEGDGIGIYMFVIRPEARLNNFPQFVMYVGIAGEGGSGRALKARLNDYMNIKNIRKRRKLHRMLKRYYHYTWIIYSEMKGINSGALEKLEEDLHGFFVPPCNDRDFPVSMKSIIKAQFTR